MVRNKLFMLLACSFKWCLGVYAGDKCPEDQAIFVTEKCCFADLVNGLSSPCLCGLTMKPWELESVTQVKNCDLHVHVSVHVLIYEPISERTCCELFSLAVVIIGKGLGQVHGFSVDIT